MCDQRLIQAAHKHLGRPWNPNGFDCWECVRAIYDDAYGIVLPTFGDHQQPAIARNTILLEAASGKWVELDRSEDGCLVMLGKRDWPHHVGVYLDLDGGKIIHCQEAQGCCIASLAMMRNIGWGFMRFYKLAGK